MTLRRVVGLVLLVTIGFSSAEVVFADEGPEADGAAASMVQAAAAIDGQSEDPDPADDCSCLCACGCVNAQVMVTPEPAEFRTTGVQLDAPIQSPLVFAKRARARPHLRPPLA